MSRRVISVPGFFTKAALTGAPCNEDQGEKATCSIRVEKSKWNEEESKVEKRQPVGHVLFVVKWFWQTLAWV